MIKIIKSKQIEDITSNMRTELKSIFFNNKYKVSKHLLKDHILILGHEAKTNYMYTSDLPKTF